MSEIIKHTDDEHEAPHEPEVHRWLIVSTTAITIARDTGSERAWLKYILKSAFNDVPDAVPSLDAEPIAHARYAVKRLLEVLTDESGVMKKAAEGATANLMRRMFGSPEV